MGNKPTPSSASKTYNVADPLDKKPLLRSKYNKSTSIASRTACLSGRMSLLEVAEHLRKGEGPSIGPGV